MADPGPRSHIYSQASDGHNEITLDFDRIQKSMASLDISYPRKSIAHRMVMSAITRWELLRQLRPHIVAPKEIPGTKLMAIDLSAVEIDVDDDIEYGGVRVYNCDNEVIQRIRIIQP